MTSSPSTSSLKVLTVGPAVGSIRELFAKVKTINAKHGKFELVLCVGDFFGPSGAGGEESQDVAGLLNGEIEAPLPCYIMQGNHPIPEKVIEKFASTGSEICRDVFLLSKSGLLTTSHGLRIACLGGLYDENVFESVQTPLGFLDPYFSQRTVEMLVDNITTTSKAASNSKASSLAALAQSTSADSHLIDILISHVWPAAISSSCSMPSAAQPPVPAFDNVVRRAKPKYHFAVGGGNPPQFWEREPFVWEDADGRVARFVSLGAFGGEHGTEKKPRWFYAFSISPSSTNGSAPARPANCTPDPFLTFSSHGFKRRHDVNEGENFIFGNVQQPTKRTRHEKAEGGKPPEGYRCRRCDSTDHFINDCPERSKPPEGYVCKICSQPGHFVRDCPDKHAPGDTGGRKPPPGYVCRACGSENHLIQDCPAAQSQKGSRSRGPPREIGPGECWFCLSNPSVAKHLLVSIGTECYVTLPKGQIIPTGDEAKRYKDISRIPGGGHVLIVPIEHHPTLGSMAPEVSMPIIDELERYKSSLRSLYAAHSCSLVSFEVGILSGKGGHAHVQVVPVPSHLVDKVEAAFIDDGKRQGIEFEPDSEKALESCSGGRANYFRVDLPDGRKLVHVVRARVPFSIQFGRQVLCNFLGIPDRMDWKACAQSDSEERADAQALKAVFAKYDTVQA